MCFQGLVNPYIIANVTNPDNKTGIKKAGKPAFFMDVKPD